MPILKKNTANLDPLEFGGRIITSVVTPLNLEPGERDFVANELRWLLYAVDNFQQVYAAFQNKVAERQKEITAQINAEERRFSQNTGLGGYTTKRRKIEEALAQVKSQLWQAVAEHSAPIAIPIPLEAECLAEADNRILLRPKTLREVLNFEEQLRGGKPPFEAELGRINIQLRTLDPLLKRETELGQAGQIDPVLQTQLRDRRRGLVEALRDIARQIEDIYGIRVTAPDELLGIM
jgi:hypothetical protein